MTNDLLTYVEPIEFNTWQSAVSYAWRKKLWGKVEVVLKDNNKYIIQPKATKEE